MRVFVSESSKKVLDSASNDAEMSESVSRFSFSLYERISFSIFPLCRAAPKKGKSFSTAPFGIESDSKTPAIYSGKLPAKSGSPPIKKVNPANEIAPVETAYSFDFVNKSAASAAETASAGESAGSAARTESSANSAALIGFAFRAIRYEISAAASVDTENPSGRRSESA